MTSPDSPQPSSPQRPTTARAAPLGLRAHAGQIAHQLAQVFFVGLTLGMLRTVVPALAESDFGVEEGAFLLLVTFVVAFGLVKGVLNFVAGRLADGIGRRPVLLLGWVAAMPVPVLVLFAPNWGWIIAATVLLGVHQGLCWSMTQAAKLDMTRAEERGLAMGLNEFAGYAGVAVAGLVTGWLATLIEPRLALFGFGAAVIGLALVLALVGVSETRDLAQAAGTGPGDDRRPAAARAAQPSTRELFVRMSWRDRRFVALNQAGLVEKFVDALVWVFYPVWLYQQGLSLPAIGWVVGVYGTVWGAAQLLTGPWSDRVGRRRPIVLGMWLCGAGVALTVLGQGLGWWTFAAAVTGFGMALLYPTLSAAIADHAAPEWRSSALGLYRFWRDLGYAVGALAFGLVAHASGAVTGAFWFVALAMFASGAWVALAIPASQRHRR